MLLTGVNGELKNATDEVDSTKLLDGTEAKETYNQDAMINPYFFSKQSHSPERWDHVQVCF
jgi:Mn-containing catalase